MSYQTVDETVWPVDDTDPSMGWTLRYGIPEAITERRYFAASIVEAYAHMTDPRITQTQAIAMLKRARRAAVRAALESLGDVQEAEKP